MTGGIPPAESNGVADTVLRIVSTMAPNTDADVAKSSRFVEDLDFDSFALLELVVALETEFALPALAGGESANVTTVGDLVRMVEHQAARAQNPPSGAPD